MQTLFSLNSCVRINFNSWAGNSQLEIFSPSVENKTPTAPNREENLTFNIHFTFRYFSDDGKNSFALLFDKSVS